MKSFQSHINEKAGNGTVDLYKKDGQGGYTADDENHDCEEEHPGVSHKKWVAAEASDDDVEEALDPKTRSSAGIRAQFDRQGKIYDDPNAHAIKKIKHSLKKGRTEIAKKRLGNLELDYARGKIKTPSDSQYKTVQRLRKKVGEEVDYLDEITAAELKKWMEKNPDKVTVGPTRGKPRTSRKVKVKGGPAPAKDRAVRAHAKAGRGLETSDYTPDYDGENIEEGGMFTKGKGLIDPKGGYRKNKPTSVQKGRTLPTGGPGSRSSVYKKAVKTHGANDKDVKALEALYKKRDKVLTQKNQGQLDRINKHIGSVEVHFSQSMNENRPSAEVSKGHTMTTMEAYHDTLSRMASRTVEVDEAIRSKPAKELQATARRVKYASSGQQEKDTAARTKKREDKERKMYGGKSLSDIAKKLGTNSVRKVMKHAETLRKEDVDEEYEIYENVAYLKNKEGHTFVVSKRDTKGMRGKQDKFSMSVVDKKGKTIEDHGSHVSVAGAKKYASSRGFTEEVEYVSEGTWELPDSAAQKKQLKKLMSKPLPVGSDKESQHKNSAEGKLYSLIGDDDLFDDIYELRDKKGEKADARPLVKKAMKRLGIRESVEVEEAVSVDGRTKGYRDAISRIAARHKVIADRTAAADAELPDTDDASADGAVEEAKRPTPGGDVVKPFNRKGADFTDSKKKYGDPSRSGAGKKPVWGKGDLVKVVHPQRGKGIVQGKVVRHDKGYSGGSPFYVIAIPGVSQSVKVSDHNMIGESILDENTTRKLNDLSNKMYNDSHAEVSAKPKWQNKDFDHNHDNEVQRSYEKKVKAHVKKNPKHHGHFYSEEVEETLDEAKAGKIMKQIRGQQGPYTVVVMDGKKVVDQHVVKISTAVPVAVKVARQEHPNAKIAVESGSGTILHTEARSSYPLKGKARQIGIKPGKNPNLRAADPKDVEMDTFLKDVSSMIGRGAKPDEVRTAIHKILPLMKKRGVKVTPQQKAALKKLGIKEEFEIDEGGLGGRTQSNVTKTGTHSSNLNYITRSKKQGWSDRGRSSAPEKKRASKEARRAGKQETEVDESRRGLIDDEGYRRDGSNPVDDRIRAKNAKKNANIVKAAAAKRKKALEINARQNARTAYNKDAVGEEVEVGEAKLRIPKETGTPGMTKARGPMTPYEKSKAFIAAYKRDNKGKYPTQAQHDKAIKEDDVTENQTGGAQKVIDNYKKRAADAKQWKKDNNKNSLGIEETANVGDKNAPVTSQDMNYLSDFYKDVYGTRPRGVYKHVKTVGDYHKEVESLSKAAEAEQQRVKQDRLDRKKGKATEKKIQRKRTFGPKGKTQKSNLTPAFQKALAKSRNRR